VGRQPWLVTGVLRTAEAVTPVAPANVGLSLTLYLATYVVLMWAYIHTLRVMALRSVKVEEFETEEPVADGSLTNLHRQTPAQYDVEVPGGNR